MIKAVTLAAVLAVCSCVNDRYDTDGGTAGGAGTVAVELSIQTQAATSTSETYVEGSEWENYVDINGGDYRIYFFTYYPTSQNDASRNNTLIAEFKPTDIFSTDLGTYTNYTMTSEIDESLIGSLTDFKVVVLANWGTYPTVTAGTTTIDDICNAQTAVFDAFVDGSGTALMPSSTLHIPFYGVREYSGVTWKSGSRTTLSGAVTLLRAVAKVEVIVANDVEDEVTFDEVSAVNYNARGYCAPTNVYLKSDYDHDYTWAGDFTDGLHLVSKDSGGNGINDPDQSGHTFTLYKTTNSDGQETWVGYLTEYANGGDDYSYLSVTVEEEPFWVYFGNYDGDGTCTAYDNSGNAEDRYDIFRNNLYRFYVTYEGGYFRVRVNRWEDVYDNEFTFGSEDEEEGGEEENP